MSSVSVERALTVRFFSTVKKVFGVGEVEVASGSAVDVAELLASVCDSQEKTRAVFAAAGELRGDITVLVNGRNIALLQGLLTPVGAGDVVAVVPPMAGG